jgi:hypothetical protein
MESSTIKRATQRPQQADYKLNASRSQKTEFAELVPLIAVAGPRWDRSMKTLNGLEDVK